MTPKALNDLAPAISPASLRAIWPVGHYTPAILTPPPCQPLTIRAAEFSSKFLSLQVLCTCYSFPLCCLIFLILEDQNKLYIP